VTTHLTSFDGVVVPGTVGAALAGVADGQRRANATARVRIAHVARPVAGLARSATVSISKIRIEKQMRQM